MYCEEICTSRDLIIFVFVLGQSGGGCRVLYGVGGCDMVMYVPAKCYTIGGVGV